MTDAAVELVRAIQRSEELCAALDDLHSSPRGDATIHGDMRWDNVLTSPAPQGWAGRRTHMVLIDWESAGTGDPALDVGTVLGEYLCDWIRSIPVVDVADPGRHVASASRPLARMRPAIGAFWRAYCDHDRDARDGRLLRRAASFAAVRVLVSAYEESLTCNELGGSALFALGLGTNILRRPDQALAHLLGLHAAWSQP